MNNDFIVAKKNLAEDFVMGLVKQICFDRFGSDVVVVPDGFGGGDVRVNNANRNCGFHFYLPSKRKISISRSNIDTISGFVTGVFLHELGTRLSSKVYGEEAGDSYSPDIGKYKTVSEYYDLMHASQWPGRKAAKKQELEWVASVTPKDFHKYIGAH